MSSVLRFGIVSGACLLLSSLVACTAAPAAPAHPLAGTYKFYEAGCRGAPPPPDMPLLPLFDMQNDTSVYVFECPDSTLLVAYTNTKGVPTYKRFSMNSSQVSWADDLLMLEWTRHSTEAFPGAPMPIAGKSFLSRTPEGDLLVVWTCDDTFVPGTGGLYTLSGTHDEGRALLLALGP